MNKDYDIIIVGTGAAGLYCALNLPTHLRVLMITKKEAKASDSFLAQGGICVLRGEKDYDAFYEDTMKAGHYVNNPKAVDLMIRSSNAIIHDLLNHDIQFNQDENGNFSYTKEGAHSRPRIMHHQDITGKEITSGLLDAVRSLPNVDLYENTTMLDIVETDNVCGGIVLEHMNTGKQQIVTSSYVVLSTGGLGGLYDNTTNFQHITGDALGIAIAHNVTMQNMDYVQIHPTSLYSETNGRRFLISESVRGEGAYLYDKNLNRFTDELMPRDKLTAVILNQMEKDGTPHVWEDMRHMGKERIMSHFPNIYDHCLKQGINVLKDLIPVVPAQHYFMGGIAVNLAGQTSMRGLYACGETACNGVHGKNRLASNSLLEALVFSKRVAEDIMFSTDHKGGCSTEHVKLEQYKDKEALLEHYKKLVLAEMERTTPS